MSTERETILLLCLLNKLIIVFIVKPDQLWKSVAEIVMVNDTNNNTIINYIAFPILQLIGSIDISIAHNSSVMINVCLT